MAGEKEDKFLKLIKSSISNDDYEEFKKKYKKGDISEDDLTCKFSWRYDETFQKSTINQEFFDIIKENLPFVTVFGADYSGREYLIQGLFNEGNNRKSFYLKEIEKNLGMKILTINKKKCMFFRAYPLDPIYFEDLKKEENLKKNQNKKFINNFLAKFSNVIIYIDNNEGNDNEDDFSKFIKNYSLDVSKQHIIYIKNIFSRRNDNNRNSNNISNMNNCSTYNIYFNDSNKHEIFRRILNEVSKYLRTQNFKELFKEYYNNYYLQYQENDYIFKCDYAELLNQKINYNLVQAQQQLIFIIEKLDIVDKNQITISNIIIDDTIYIKINLNGNDVNDVIYQKINIQTRKKAITNLEIIIQEKGGIKVIFSL